MTKETVGGAINPLDGRYFKKTRALAPYFSEEALMKYRLMMEGEYLIALSFSRRVALRKFTSKEIKIIRNIYEKFDNISYKKIKNIEAVTNHDVKAVEYFIKEKLSKTSLGDSIEWVHFALTSEDTNNIAYALMLSDSLEYVLVPRIKKIVLELDVLAKKYKNSPMLARTHGQSASPTTFGKEMKVFAARLEKKLKELAKIKIQAKLNGATGNYNAHVIAYPQVNWLEFSKKFIKSFNKNRSQKLETNLITTQIESHDSYVAVFDAIRRINTILIDFNQDIWRYISDNWVTQKPKAGETGSSTMPHKINPIDFENSEGNLGLANALFEFFARKLPISRLQRDLSDSTVERAFGTALGHSLLAYLMLEKGLEKINVNEIKIKEDLLAHPEVIAEAIQTILRRENYPVPYEMLKDLTRDKQVTMQDFAQFIDTLKISPKVKLELKKITPLNYTGLASKLALG
ncbi:adenylosuccinate lyase [Candidatus Nomurabacteria bacterium RIFCSPHIGHO2_02_FULL_37_13]|uniref:Adenylosuccinate lyase n=1 Tax=Candidatus Nomurabacteria bacterium RIFCSPHIGHO2_02_FULL_37_13 TaxID=1801750 RepID=A0A1F6W7A0_9BACT|nr:MAG: adenylosuccinate lyase [Candidatus Nomurabacteria bacterium RIFCSPHIGHO2_01_FULL_36_23]OGI77672.1 MAG: adenylosuccinate lyase [Candidatus Nomurabacteria bacterium RIFCSPHIGHO2_02_FULL_37_13]OGI88312.1 MAG: adenylosuccinate lyase [Candidatus Nomurabacteria bacterium RIFCSPLOWO2_01_FULL_37_25]